jgi:hypothetical protein
VIPCQGSTWCPIMRLVCGHVGIVNGGPPPGKDSVIVAVRTRPSRERSATTARHGRVTQTRSSSRRGPAASIWWRCRRWHSFTSLGRHGRHSAGLVGDHRPRQ